MRSAKEELGSSKEELEKQKQLNERLETDLLQLNKHVNGNATGPGEKSRSATPSKQQDGLAGLNIGSKGNVGGTDDSHTQSVTYFYDRTR